MAYSSRSMEESVECELVGRGHLTGGIGVRGVDGPNDGPVCSRWSLRATLREIAYCFRLSTIRDETRLTMASAKLLVG